MAGIKIHQYPLERTSIGDEDYYDIDYWTGSSYQSAKIKGSTLKNVLGANYIDIQDFSSGYTLKPTDAGKLITNAGSLFRDLIVDTTLQAPGHGFTVKGRVEIKPALGVNIDLPDGTTITNPSSFICGSESFYVLQRKGFTGTNWILVEVKKSENIGTNDLIITDTVRELQVATDGTFQIVTNDANNSAIFKVGENSNERFSEIEFNTVIFDLLSKFQNPAITAGVIVEVNPNEFKFIVLPDTSNTSVYHGLISVDANKTIIEKSNAGKLLLDSSSSANTFEDLRATKKGLEYSADYSANFSVRSLVDKGYVDSQDATKQDTLVSGVNIRTINGQTLLGSTDIVINSENIYTNNGTIGSGRVATLTDTLSFAGGRVSFDTTDNGILLPRLTTAQMNAIASPATNLLVYNTDLNGLYRYNGSTWVALSTGYGIIGVYSGSGDGTPTFFADLQSALETCKASGGYFTVKLYSNITITSAIEIDYTNTGVGNAYLFRQLTIDFNGFSVTNAQANTSNAFTVELSNSASVYQEIKFINGAVLRTNGTGTHHALKCDTAGRYGTIQMNNMYWYCQNGFAISIDLSVSTNVEANKINDLGGSTFISQTNSAFRAINNTGFIVNFKAVSHGSVVTVNTNNGKMSNFLVENTSSGNALNATSSAECTNFEVVTNTGKGIVMTSNKLTKFKVKSVSGIGVDMDVNSGVIDDFEIETGNNYGINAVGSAGGNAIITNGKVVTNGATQSIRIYSFGEITNLNAINKGSGIAYDVRNNNNTKSVMSHCKGTSAGNRGASVTAVSGSTLKIDNCIIESDWNNSAGHAIQFNNLGAFLVTNSHFTVNNASANVFYATTPVTVKSRYCTHNDVATTPINANVIIVSSGIIS